MLIFTIKINKSPHQIKNKRERVKSNLINNHLINK